MARSPAEIQADIALTRRVIERQLDALTPHVPARVVDAVADRRRRVSAVGLAPVPGPDCCAWWRLGARAVQAGIAVAGTVAAVDRFLAERRRPGGVSATRRP